MHPDGARLDAFLPGGEARLGLRPLAGADLSGMAEFTTTPVTAIGEGLGPAVLLPAGATRWFSFHLDQKGPIGAGVRSTDDRADLDLYDRAGRRARRRRRRRRADARPRARRLPPGRARARGRSAGDRAPGPRRRGAARHRTARRRRPPVPAAGRGRGASSGREPRPKPTIRDRERPRPPRAGPGGSHEPSVAACWASAWIVPSRLPSFVAPCAGPLAAALLRGPCGRCRPAAASPASRPTIVPDRFLRRWDPVTVFFAQPTRPGQGRPAGQAGALRPPDPGPSRRLDVARRPHPAVPAGRALAAAPALHRGGRRRHRLARHADVAADEDPAVRGRGGRGPGAHGHPGAPRAARSRRPWRAC